MSERLKHVESGPTENESEPNNEVLPVTAEKAEYSKNETINAEKTRERINEIHRSSSGSSQQPQDESAKARAVLPSFEAVSDTINRKLGAIRQNLSPSDKRFSKVIHNPVVSKVSEATAKTLARPYAILSGGIVACIGSAVYMYYTRHLGYSYNFFVPILLFFVGLLVGIAVELLYKFLHLKRKRNS